MRPGIRGVAAPGGGGINNPLGGGGAAVDISARTGDDNDRLVFR